jgi:hypothetical protein
MHIKDIVSVSICTTVRMFRFSKLRNGFPFNCGSNKQLNSQYNFGPYGFNITDLLKLGSKLK